MSSVSPVVHAFQDLPNPEPMRLATTVFFSAVLSVQAFAQEQLTVVVEGAPRTVTAETLPPVDLDSRGS